MTVGAYTHAFPFSKEYANEARGVVQAVGFVMGQWQLKTESYVFQACVGHNEFQKILDNAT